MSDYFFRGGPNYPLPYQIEGAPLELYRTHEHQARPAMRAEGLERFLPGAYREHWLPQSMGQQQWKRDDDGIPVRYDSSARTYVAAIEMAAPPNARATALPRVAPPRSRDAFQALADGLMVRGAWRRLGDPYQERARGPAIARSVPPQQILPSDLEALAVYEEGAETRGAYLQAKAVRTAMNEIRDSDESFYSMMRRR